MTNHYIFQNKAKSSKKKKWHCFTLLKSLYCLVKLKTTSTQTSSASWCSGSRKAERELKTLGVTLGRPMYGRQHGMGSGAAVKVAFTLKPSGLWRHILHESLSSSRHVRGAWETDKNEYVSNFSAMKVDVKAQ